MNITATPVNFQAYQHNNTCTNPTCTKCTTIQVDEFVPTVAPQQTQQENKVAKFFSAVKQGSKKAVAFCKEHKEGIKTGAVALAKGLCASCAVIGARQLLGKLTRINSETTSSLVNKLALLSGFSVATESVISDIAAKKVSKKD